MIGITPLFDKLAQSRHVGDVWDLYTIYLHAIFVVRLAVYSKWRVAKQLLNVPSAFVLHLTAPNLDKKTICRVFEFSRDKFGIETRTSRLTTDWYWPRKRCCGDTFSSTISTLIQRKECGSFTIILSKCELIFYQNFKMHPYITSSTRWLAQDIKSIIFFFLI